MYYLYAQLLMVAVYILSNDYLHKGQILAK